MTKIGLFGLGSMGQAYATRLAAFGVDLILWNRTATVSRALADSISASSSSIPAVTFSLEFWKDSSRQVTVIDDYYEALDACSIAIFAVSDFHVLRTLLIENEKVLPLLSNRVVVSLCSGSPDDARSFASAFAERASGALYIDGCYAGAPAAARGGLGMLFLSVGEKYLSTGDDVAQTTLLDDGFFDLPGAPASAARASIPELAAETLKLLGGICLLPKMGSNRALDYGVVDLYLAVLAVYNSSLPVLAAEGVDSRALADLGSRRLGKVLPAFGHYNAAAAKALAAHPDDEAVRASVGSHNVVSVAVCEDFFSHRQDYLSRLGGAVSVNQDISKFFSGVFADAGERFGSGADLSALACTVPK